MRRNTINFLVDAASALVVIGLVATGLLTRFVLPPGSGSWRLLWGMGRHDWGDVHFWLAVVGGVCCCWRTWRCTGNGYASPCCACAVSLRASAMHRGGGGAMPQASRWLAWLCCCSGVSCGAHGWPSVTAHRCPSVAVQPGEVAKPQMVRNWTAVGSQSEAR